MNTTKARSHRILALTLALAAGSITMGMSPDSGQQRPTMVRGKAVHSTATRATTPKPVAEPKQEQPTQPSEKATHTDDTDHWGYEGKNGPVGWGSMTDCEECDAGFEQSPVDIPAGMPTHEADIEFNYQPMALTLVNNGHTVQVNASRDSFIEVEGKQYDLLQFHFHALSEHTINGQHSDMEVHFVHKSADGEYAVVGVLLERGEHNAAFAPVFSNLPTQAGQSLYAKGVAINTVDLLPMGREYFRYDGSFTTPPCTEGVKWFVMEQPVELSAEQVSSFTALYNNNFRPVQPIGERKFIAGSSSCECCQARKVLSGFSGAELSE